MSASRSRYLLEQERKKEIEDKKRQAHAASLFEAEAKKIEAAFEVTRKRREEDENRRLQEENKVQLAKFKRDQKRAEEVRLAFAKQQEAARQFAQKDILWRKKCYAASLLHQELPHEPSLSGIILACCVSSAYESVGSVNQAPVPSKALRHIRALFPQTVDMVETEMQTITELSEEMRLRKNGFKLGPTISSKRNVIYVTAIGPTPAGWGEALSEYCHVWFASSVNVRFLPSICPKHRWKSLLAAPIEKEVVEAEEGLQGLAAQFKKRPGSQHDKKKKKAASNDSIFQSQVELDLFAAHDLLGRLFRENPNCEDAALLLAFTFCDLVSPKSQAKIATKTAAQRVRPRFVTEDVAHEAQLAHTEEIEHAAALTEYAKVIAPCASPHWSVQSLDLGQSTGVVSLFPPHQRKNYIKRQMTKTLGVLPSIPAGHETGHHETGHHETGHETGHSEIVTASETELGNELSVLRKCLGSLPYAAASLLGFKPCESGHHCSLRPASFNAAKGLWTKPENREDSTLHCCPLCLHKTCVILSDSKAPFSPLTRERLFLSSFSSQPTLRQMGSLLHEELEWSRALVSAVELEVFGSDPNASAAYVAWKKCTPKPFEKFRHKFKALHASDLSAEALSDCTIALKKGLVNHPAEAPPYPSTKRISEPRMLASLEEVKVPPWRAGPGMLWNDHSLVTRSGHHQAVAKDFWKDPLKTKFGGISHGQSPQKQVIDKFPDLTKSESDTQSPPIVSQSVTESAPIVSQSVTESVPIVSQSVTESENKSQFSIRRAGGMYSYGSFELARARIIPVDEPEPPPPVVDDSASRRSSVTFSTQSSFGSPSGSTKSRKSRRKSKRGKK